MATELVTVDHAEVRNPTPQMTSTRPQPHSPDTRRLMQSPQYICVHSDELRAEFRVVPFVLGSDAPYR